MVNAKKKKSRVVDTLLSRSEHIGENTSGENFRAPFSHYHFQLYLILFLIDA
jgi:hypothetical protein